jgi:hypothetical protein
MIEPKDRIRADRSALEAALIQAGAVIKGKSVKCPWHDDRHPSGSIYMGEDGAWRFKCQTASCGFCGDVFDVRQRVTGQTVEDQLRELSEHDQRPAPPKLRVYATLDELKAGVYGLEQAHVYTNPATQEPDMVVLRCRDSQGAKTFIQARPEGAGFVMRAPAQPWPLYNRKRMAAADRVVVVEGEKCVESLASIGIVATTSPCGAGKGSCADWTPVAGKRVVLWPDNDPADPKTGKSTGIEHMRQVAEILQKMSVPPSEVRWLDPEILNLPDKGDCVDYIAEYGGATAESRRESIEAALSLAAPLCASADLLELIEDSIAGKRKTVAWPWRNLTRLSRALMPGTVTAICGDPGCGKSLLILETAEWWHTSGVKVAVYELEEDRTYHLARLLSQLDNNSDLTDAEWIRANPDASRQAYLRHRQRLDSFTSCIDAAPDNQITHATLLKWMEDRAKSGCRVIAIDPITAAATSDKPWVDDLNFLMAAKKIVRDYGCSLVLVTHPRKGKRSGMPLDDLAGGAAYPRFSQCVLWIVRHERKRSVVCSSPYGNFSASINRSIRLGKTRNGPGAGMEIGFIFDPASLRFSEQGPVVKENEDVEQEIPV